MTNTVCKHPLPAHVPHAHTKGCEECLKMGDTWVHLRLCLECGHVGCCDSSKNRHASAHYRHTGHPLIQSAQPGEHWRWCYADEVYID